MVVLFRIICWGDIEVVLCKQTVETMFFFGIEFLLILLCTKVTPNNSVLSGPPDSRKQWPWSRQSKAIKVFIAFPCVISPPASHAAIRASHVKDISPYSKYFLRARKQVRIFGFWGEVRWPWNQKSPLSTRHEESSRRLNGMARLCCYCVVTLWGATEWSPREDRTQI